MTTRSVDTNNWSSAPHKLRPHLPSILVLGLILAYGIYFSLYTVARHHALMTQSFDLSVYVQSLWNTLNGDFFRVTIQPGKPVYFQHHFAPSMLLFVPLYALWPDPVWLLILQSFIVASGAWPIYRLTKSLTNRGAVAVGLALVYLLSPALQAANLYDFHEITIAAPLLIWAWYFAVSNRWVLFAIVGVLALGFREEAVIIMLGMGVLLSLKKSPRRIGVITLAGSGLWLVFLMLVSFYQANFDMNAAMYFESRFNLGSTPLEALVNIIEDPQIVFDRILTSEKAYYVTNLFASVGFLSFFSWETLFLVAPSVVLNLLSDSEYLYSPAQAQYNAMIAPFVVYTAAVGFKGVVNFLSHRMKYRPTFWQNILLLFVLLLSLGYHFRLAHLPYSPYFKWPQITERDLLAREIASEIPVNESLSVQDNLAPHASHRHDLFVFPIVNQAKYVYIDLEWIEAVRTAGIIDLTPQLNQILADPQYEVVIKKQGLLLLRHK